MKHAPYQHSVSFVRKNAHTIHTHANLTNINLNPQRCAAVSHHANSPPAAPSTDFYRAAVCQYRLSDYVPDPGPVSIFSDRYIPVSRYISLAVGRSLVSSRYPCHDCPYLLHNVYVHRAYRHESLFDHYHRGLSMIASRRYRRLSSSPTLLYRYICYLPLYQFYLAGDPCFEDNLGHSQQVN